MYSTEDILYCIVYSIVNNKQIDLSNYKAATEHNSVDEFLSPDFPDG